MHVLKEKKIAPSEAEQLLSTKKKLRRSSCFLLGNSITRRIKRCEKTSLTKKSCVFSRSRNSPALPPSFFSPPSLTATMFAQTDLFLLSQYYNTSFPLPLLFPAQPHFFPWPNSIVHFPASFDLGKRKSPANRHGISRTVLPIIGKK